MLSDTFEAVVAERLEGVRARVASASGGRQVRIVAVTKGFGADAVVTAVACGVSDLGENYAQELLAKAPKAPGGVQWHFLGAIQTNKVARLAPVVAAWHALDRRAAVDALARHRPGAEVFVEVNVTGDPAKHGVHPAATPKLVDYSRDRGLDVRGLMAVGAYADKAGSRAAFARLAGLARKLGLAELSMGMSDDFEEAVAEGATTVRLGRALFGPRPA